jgi:large subunit ribosomal protein L32
MTPLPKQRISRGRKNRRRAHHALKPKQLVQCSNCGEKRLPHRVCSHCGYYRGREVVAK